MFRWLNRAFIRLLVRRIAPAYMYGMPFRVYARSDDETPYILRRIENAMELVARYDNIRLARLCRDLPAGVLVWPATGGTLAAYDPDTRLCYLNSDFVQREDVSELSIAGLLVHEGTHARLWRCGFREEMYTDHQRRVRIEQICTRAEIAFVSRVPGAEAFVSSLQLQLSSIGPEYDDDAIIRQRTRTAINLGVPSWLARFAAALRRRR